MTEIIPSILVKSKEEFFSQIESVRKSVNSVQLDIADGIFVPNVTWADPQEVSKLSNIEIELHLMIQNPIVELKKWAKISQIFRVLIHFETVKNLSLAIDEIQKINNNWQIGVVFNPDTKFEQTIDEWILKIDSVMFMGVYPGFQGQRLIEDVLINIQKFKNKYPKIFVEIDGGVNMETLPKIIKSGVDAICPGSAVFGNKNTPQENIEKMREIIKKLKAQISKVKTYT